MVTNYTVTRLIFMLVAALSMSVPAAAATVETNFMQGLGDAHYQHIDSEIIGRGYHLYIMLPDGYDSSSEEYHPTIYLLDGGALFPLFAAYYRYLNFGEEVPDAIIVGISYGSGDFESGNYRSTDYTAESEERDYWGGAGKFQTFLSDELFPFIERTYRSRAERRVIFGQSIGGQFVLYTALTRPNLFWGHIASNPALHSNLPFFLQKHSDAAMHGDRPRLFVASGSMDDPRFRAPALKWIEHWSDKDNIPWRLKTMTLEGHTHMSAPPASFRHGLAWLFSTDYMAELTDFATRYAAAWSSQDPVAFASFYAENGSFRINEGEPSIGRDAIEEVARSFMASFPDMVVRLVELRQKKDDVEFHWHWTGTNTGPGGTGNAVDLRGFEQWTLGADGLILESRGNMDDAEYQRQLNANPPTNESNQ